MHPLLHMWSLGSSSPQCPSISGTQQQFVLLASICVFLLISYLSFWYSLFHPHLRLPSCCPVYFPSCLTCFLLFCCLTLPSHLAVSICPPSPFHVLGAGQPPCALCSELSIPLAVQEKMQRIPPFPVRYLGSAPWLPTAGCRSCWQEPVVWWSDMQEAASPLFLLLSPWRGAERVPGFPSAKGREAQEPGGSAGQSGDLACHRRARPALTLLRGAGLVLKQKEFRGNASMELFGILYCPLCNAAVPGRCLLLWAGSVGAPCPWTAHLLTPQCHRPARCRAPSCCFQPGTRDFPDAALCWLVVSLPSTKGIVSRFWGAREEQHHEGLRAALGNTA